MIPETDEEVHAVFVQEFSPAARDGLSEIYDSHRRGGKSPREAFVVALAVMVDTAEVADDGP